MRIVPATFLILACTGSGDVITDCDDRDGLRPVCRFQHPEDIAVPGDGAVLIVSEMGNMLDRESRGFLSLFDRASEERRISYPREGAASASPTPGWGDPDCPGERPDDFSPHGIDLAQRPDGRWRLLVVSHGQRESVEFFEVTGRGATLEVEWRGCAIPPEGLFFNDLVNLPDGGLLATHMMNGSPIFGVLSARMGFDTGGVYEWQPPAVWKPIAGTEAPFPNGIEVSEDAAEIFLNAYGAGEVRRIRRADGALLATAAVPSPDNSSWGRDGKLLVASHRGTFADEVRCRDIRVGACPMAFEILALDAETLEGDPVFSHVGSPMGGGTVAVDLGHEWVIGSFTGDRLLRVPR